MLVFDCEADVEGVLQGAGLIEAMHHSSYSSQAPIQVMQHGELPGLMCHIC